MNRLIHITIKNKVAKGHPEEYYVCGNKDFKAVFDFDDDWADYRFKTARFTYGGKYYDVVFEGNECEIPRIVGTKEIDIGVFATDDIASTPVRVRAKESIVCEEGMPDDPPEDVYAQIMELLQYIKENTDLDFIEVNGTNLSFNTNYNKVGLTKYIGTFECTDIADGKYVFGVEDTAVFVNSELYRIVIDGVKYPILSREINEDNVVFSGDAPIEVGESYEIYFITNYATAFGHSNTNYANNGFVTGSGNILDETGDQTSVSGYENTVSGKNHRVSGYNNKVRGHANSVSGQGNEVDGQVKLVSGYNLIAVECANGCTVLGKYNIDVPGAKFILGCGTDNSNRKNAIVVDKDGQLIIGKKLALWEANTGKFDYLYANGENVSIELRKKANSSEVVPTRKYLLLTGDATAEIDGVKTVIGKYDGNQINFAEPNTKGYQFRHVESFTIPVKLNALQDEIIDKELLGFECNKMFTDRMAMGEYTCKFVVTGSVSGENNNGYIVSDKNQTITGNLVFTRGIEEGHNKWSWCILGKFDNGQLFRVSTKMLPGYELMNKKLKALEDAIISLGGII